LIYIIVDNNNTLLKYDNKCVHPTIIIKTTANAITKNSLYGPNPVLVLSSGVGVGPTLSHFVVFGLQGAHGSVFVPFPQGILYHGTGSLPTLIS
jgi:hypothetical protein